MIKTPFTQDLKHNRNDKGVFDFTVPYSKHNMNHGKVNRKLV